jgi:hypothetical protein
MQVPLILGVGQDAVQGGIIREIVDQRPDARSAYKRVMDLVSTRRPSIRIFDQDGQVVSLTKLRRVADEESVKTH